MDDISVEVYNRRKTEDSFDLFGKTIAFQLRTVDISNVDHDEDKYNCHY